MEPQFIVSLSGCSLSEASALVKIPLLQLGRWVKGTVKFAITLADVKRLIDNFRKRQTGEVVIDFEHASELPDRAMGGPIPAAGWLKAVEDEPDSRGILWGLAEFTSRAREMIAAKEYKYLSPAIDWSARDKSSGEQQGPTLTSVALVNRPFLEALPAIQLSEAGWCQEGGGSISMPEKTLFEDYDLLSRYLCKLAHEREAEKGIAFRQALDQIRNENPALCRLSEALYMQRARGKGNTRFYEWVDGSLREVEQNIKGLIEKAQQEHPGLSAGQAFKLVASEHPDLVRERESLRQF